MASSEEVLQESIVEFTKRLDISLPLRHPSECVDAEKLKRISQLESKVVFHNLKEKNSVFKNRKTKLDLENNFHSKVKELTEEYQKKNEDLKEKAESFLKKRVKDLCEDFKSTSGDQFFLAPEMDMKRVEKVLETGKESAIRYFEQHSSHGYAGLYEKQKRELEQELDKLGSEMLGQQRRHWESISEEKAGKELEKLKHTVQEMSKQVRDDAGKWNVSKRKLKDKVQNIHRYVMENGSDFLSKGKNWDIYSELMRFEAGESMSAEDFIQWTEGLRMEVQLDFETGIQATEVPHEPETSSLEDKGDNELEFTEETIKEESMEMDYECDEWEAFQEIDIDVKIENTEGLVLHKSCQMPDSDVNESNLQIAKQQDGNAHETSRPMPAHSESDIALEKAKLEGSSAEENPSIVFETRQSVNDDGLNEGLIHETTQQQSDITQKSASTEREEYGKVPECLLIFKLMDHSVSMGSMSEEHFEILPDWNGDMSTPIDVGINSSGQFVCGKDAKMCEKHWLLGEILGGTDADLAWRTTATFKLWDKIVTREIRAEFLFGCVLRSMKEQAETHTGKGFNIAVITVPAWFCLSHRIQVKDAAKIAGFDEVHTVSEESITALALALRQQDIDGRKEKTEVLIISRSRDVLFARLYQFDPIYPLYPMNQFMDEVDGMHTHGCCRDKYMSLVKLCGFCYEHPFILGRPKEKNVPLVTFLPDPDWSDVFCNSLNKTVYARMGNREYVASNMAKTWTCVLSKMKLGDLDTIVSAPRSIYSKESKPIKQHCCPCPEWSSLEMQVESDGTKILKLHQFNVPKKSKIYVGQLDLTASYEQINQQLLQRSMALPVKYQVDFAYNVANSRIVSVDRFSWVGHDAQGKAVGEGITNFKWMTPNLWDSVTDELKRLIDVIWLAKNNLSC